MTQQRGIVTDQLNNVIQVIQLGKKTGRLTVERGEGANREYGEMIFAYGQLTDAHNKQWHGQSAWNRLKQWEACRFIFTPTSEQATGPLPPVVRTTTRPLPIVRTTTRPLQEFSPQYHDTPEHGLRITSPLNVIPIGTIPQRVIQTDDGLYLLSKAGLSRIHRNIFLLIDGRKTTFELARLIGKSGEETQQLLRDLDTLGLIQQ